MAHEADHVLGTKNGLQIEENNLHSLLFYTGVNLDAVAVVLDAVEVVLVVEADPVVDQDEVVAILAAEVAPIEVVQKYQIAVEVDQLHLEALVQDRAQGKIIKSILSTVL